MSSNTRIALVIVLAASLAGAALVYAERGSGRPEHGLTEEQREAIHAKVEEMREAGASGEEIREAIEEMLASYGVQVPEGPPEGRQEGRCEGGFNGHGPGGPFQDQLTEEQREAIHAKIDEMRDAGASREQIHEAIREMLQGYGIEPPEHPPEGFPKGPPGHHGPGRAFADQLTEDQHEAIHAKVHEMHEAGASREEIRAAVREMLEGFGVDLPECPRAGEASSSTQNLSENPGEGKRWGEIKGRFE